MEQWADVREVAARRHERFGRPRGDGLRPWLLGQVAAAGLRLDAFMPGEDLGAEVIGHLDRGRKVLSVSKLLPPARELVTIAHELGHFDLHADERTEDLVSRDDFQGVGANTSVRGYSARETKEVQANVFAAELLCPSELVRARLASGRPVSWIAARLGLPRELVRAQAVRALLPPDRANATAQPRRPEGPVTPDPAQASLASRPPGALVVRGAAGNGKTTLVRMRVGHLVASGAPPASILVVTDGDMAAEAMRAALAAAHPSTVGATWVGSMAAFATEILAKWAGDFDRDGVVVLDHAAATTLAATLLRADGSAPVPPYGRGGRVDRGAPRARDATGRAQGPDQRVWSAELDRLGLVDHAGLARSALRVARRDRAVRRALCDRFEHLVADDAHHLGPDDVRLLAEIFPEGADAWFLGDEMQAIHGHLGALAEPLAAVAAVFGAQTATLPHHHRAGAAVASAAAAFRLCVETRSPHAGSPGPAVRVTRAPDEAGEGRAIAEWIGSLRAEGVAFRDQAVIARSNAFLHRIAARLREAGVPVAHLGDLWGRRDVRTLHDVASLGGAPRPGCLERVLGLPCYGALRDDAAKLEAAARREEGRGHRRILALRVPASVSNKGRTALDELRADLVGLRDDADPADVLRHWLFERMRMVPTLLGIGGLESRLALLAIHHVVMICEENGQDGPDLLERRIRTVGSLRQLTHFRKLDLGAAPVDAVRVMTVHAARGSEFRAIHFAGLTERRLPSSHSDEAGATAWADLLGGAEARVFHVGLSRAREFLHLTHAAAHRGVASGASPFLRCLVGERAEDASAAPRRARALRA